MDIEKIRKEKADLVAQAKALVETHQGDEWTDEVEEKYQGLKKAITAKNAEIERYQDMLQFAADDDNAPAGSAARVDNREAQRPYASLGEQLMDVVRADNPSGPDPVAMERLMVVHNEGTGLNTEVGSDGGFLVGTQFAQELWRVATETGVLSRRCTTVPIGADFDSLEWNGVDETSRATGSRWGGVQVYRRSEAATVTATKPKFDRRELRLEDLMGLCYVTNRALKDATSLGAIVTMAFGEEFGFKLDDEIIRGNGAGECLGVLESDALVSVAKETGQPNDTIIKENVDKMWARMFVPSLGRAEWFINQECYPQLFALEQAVGTGGSPMFYAPGAMSQAPNGTLLGKPITPLEQSSALGDLGDILFADFSQYLIIDKGGMDAQQSIHVRFIYDETAFKFITRNNGQPFWKTSQTPYKGAAANKVSPFIGLAAR
jgi:HK97 family phage major capsid protein